MPEMSEELQTSVTPLAKFCANDAMAIDLHTHTFNALYLPVPAILAYFCRYYTKGVIDPSIGYAVGRLLELITIVKTGLRGAAPAEAMRLLTLDLDDETVRQRILAETSPEMIDDPVVRKGIAAISKQAERRLAETMVSAEAATSLLDRLLRAVEPAVPESVFGQDESSDAAGTASAIRGFLRWIWLMTEPDANIAAQLCAASPKVGLFVHHLMDMANWYDRGQTHYSVWPTQFTRAQTIAKNANGRLLTFVAFDPKRKTSLDGIKKAWARGAAGVKFYPPNGYRPAENPDHADWDAAASALFDWCVSQDVPILSHCTPSGFQADIGGHSGCNADPMYWYAVLTKNDDRKRLRVCFGHAGGDDWWLDKTDHPCDHPFTPGVLDLCRSFDNVYCEVAYMDIWNNPPEFAAHLSDALNDPKLSRKVAYGTDWLMPQMVIHKPADYFDLFEEIVAAHRDDFFWKNASRFLNLGAYVKRAPAWARDHVAKFVTTD